MCNPAPVRAAPAPRYFERTLSRLYELLGRLDVPLPEGNTPTEAVRRALSQAKDLTAEEQRCSEAMAAASEEVLRLEEESASTLPPLTAAATAAELAAARSTLQQARARYRSTSAQLDGVYQALAQDPIRFRHFLYDHLEEVAAGLRDESAQAQAMVRGLTEENRQLARRS